MEPDHYSDLDSPDWSELDDTEYSILNTRNYKEKPVSKKKPLLIKETQIHSSVFTHIYNDFLVNTNKRFQGLASTSINDEVDQYLGIPEEDSQMDVFSDEEDDLIADISGTTDELPTEVRPNEKSNDQSKTINLQSIKIIVKLTSLLVDDIEYPLSAPVRACCRVPGISDSCSREEDALLVSLASGFVLLIKIFHLPRSITDTDYERYGPEVTQQRSEMKLFKPFVVQWWDTSPKNPQPTLEASGHKLCAHSSGLTAVSTSASNIFRIYNIQHTASGIQFLPQHNEPVNGLILHACLSEPCQSVAAASHVSFLTFVYTDGHRLNMVLYSWSLVDTISESLNKSTLPLQNTFVLPVHVVPLRYKEAFLLINTDELAIVTPHSIISADYKFMRVPIDITFPTAFYKPRSVIFKEEEKHDEVLVATEDGTIYCILVTDGLEIGVIPIARISDPISVFTLEETEQGFLLIFGCDTGSNRELLLPKLFEADLLQKSNTLPYSSVQVLCDYKSWSPILDVLVVEVQKQRSVGLHSNQELWALTGTGKRTRITQLRDAYNASRNCKAWTKSRKVNRIFHLRVGGRDYIACSFPFETVCIDCESLQDEDVEEVPSEALLVGSRSLLVCQYSDEDERVIQVTAERVVVSDLTEILTTIEFEEETVLFCDKLHDCIVFILRDNSARFTLSVYKLSSNGPSDFGDQVGQLQLNYEPSLVKILDVDNTFCVLVGGYDESLRLYDLLELEKEALEIDFGPPKIAGTDSETAIYVPHDAAMLRNELVVGTKNGHVVRFRAEASTFKLSNSTRVGDMPALLRSIQGDDNMLIIICQTLWLLNYYESSVPRRISFDERLDKVTSDVAQISNGVLSHKLPVCFAREEGISLGSISTGRAANVKQANIAESGKKMVFLPHISTFAVLCHSKNPHSRLKFLDRKQFKLMESKEYNSHNRLLLDTESIFAKDEIPMAGLVWSIERQDRVSKKLIVGCSVNDKMGSFKVIDVSKSRNGDSEQGYLAITELACFEAPAPIRSLALYKEWILCACGRSIYFTSYTLEDRKLKPLRKMVDFNSEVMALDCGKVLHVTTKDELVITIDYMLFWDSFDTEYYDKTCKDPVPKSLVNLAILNKYIVAGDKRHSTVHFFCRERQLYHAVASWKMPGIVRVYPAQFQTVWNDKPVMGVLCAAVNGEITMMRMVLPDSAEAEKIAVALGGVTTEQFLMRLERPFKGKMTGKCLKSVSTVYFGFKDNKAALIDYDISELSRANSRPSGI